MPGTAILSPSLKSLIDLMSLRCVTNRNGIACAADSARTSFAVPAVLSHSVASPGTPVMPKFTERNGRRASISPPATGWSTPMR
jgi:hypothetical protein